MNIRSVNLPFAVHCVALCAGQWTVTLTRRRKRRRKKESVLGEDIISGTNKQTHRHNHMVTRSLCNSFLSSEPAFQLNPQAVSEFIHSTTKLTTGHIQDICLPGLAVVDINKFPYGNESDSVTTTVTCCRSV